MPLGKFNVIVLTLTYQGFYTGTGSEATITAPMAVLPFRAKLVKVRARITSADSSTTSNVLVKTGSTTVASFTLTDTTTSASGTITNAEFIYPENTAFFLTQNTTNTKKVNDISVTLAFRMMEP